jgi:hypothetical protein
MDIRPSDIEATLKGIIDKLASHGLAIKEIKAEQEYCEQSGKLRWIASAKLYTGAF